MNAALSTKQVAFAWGAMAAFALVIVAIVVPIVVAEVHARRAEREKGSAK